MGSWNKGQFIFPCGNTNAEFPGFAPQKTLAKAILKTCIRFLKHSTTCGYTNPEFPTSSGVAFRVLIHHVTDCGRSFRVFCEVLRAVQNSPETGKAPKYKTALKQEKPLSLNISQSLKKA